MQGAATRLHPMTASARLPPRRRLALLVACALLVRALIPEGFMPAAGAGGLTVELCPGAGVMPPGHAGHPSRDPGGTHQTNCVFSTGASAAFAAALPAPGAAPALPAREPMPAAEREHVPAILRAQSPRAPPLPA